MVERLPDSDSKGKKLNSSVLSAATAFALPFVTAGCDAIFSADLNNDSTKAKIEKAEVAAKAESQNSGN